MLPYVLYEVLPYIYLGAGAFGSVLSDSDFVRIASILMILAGFIIIWMRVDYRRNFFESDADEMRYIRRSADRRQKSLAGLPFLDDRGNLIKFDRRLGERRVLELP